MSIPTTLLGVSPANPDDMIGRLIDGRYQIRSLIARGGMATVYVATDLRLERRVAIKIMHDHLAADDNFRARFIREARAAAKLQHPNVVNVYDQGEDQSFAYIVMEYVPGITLRDLLHDHQKLTAEQTIDVMDAVLSGLQAAHRVGIVHRDLKPENVLLADDGRIKLSDFGLARAASANTASGQVLLGTIAYLSPELVTKGTAGIRSDIYSLGIMMYEMLTGEQPYRGDQPVNIAYRHANEDVPPPSDVQPDVPSELDDLVAWSTERDPDERPADAGAMLAALRQAEADLSGRPRQTASTVAGVPLGNEFREPIAQAEPVNWDDWEDGEPTDPSTQLLFASPAQGSFHPDVPPAGGALALHAGGDVALLEADPDAAALADGQQPRKRRRWLAVTIIAVLVLALVGGGGGWYFFMGPGSYEAVPEVAGQTLEAAQADIEGLGFALGDVSEEPSLDVPEGNVLRTDPEPGVTLAPGTPINLW
ncbi:MAG: Stk1 family PASTA domain-containing Ser/Thr kinase, partial [Pseudoclavibacter sp.]